MEYEFVFPVTKIDSRDQIYISHELTARAIIDCDSDGWEIGELAIWGWNIERKDFEWYDVATADPMFEQMVDHLMRQDAPEISELYQDWLCEADPDEYRSQYTHDEHRTY